MCQYFEIALEYEIKNVCHYSKNQKAGKMIIMKLFFFQKYLN